MRFSPAITVSGSSRYLLGAGYVALFCAVSCSGTVFTADSGAGTGGTLAAGGVSSAGAAHHAGAGAGGATHGSADAGVEGGALGLGGANDSAGAAGVSETAGAAGEGGEGGGGACLIYSWFPDDDEDGFGRGTSDDLSCAMPPYGTWSHQPGDCNDDDKGVYPDEQAFHADGYPVGNGTSFDYDCSGKEEADPGQLGAAPACASLSVLNCSGSGFAPSGRTGPNVNPICGSKTIVKCVQSGLSCTAVSSAIPDGARCR